MLLMQLHEHEKNQEQEKERKRSLEPTGHSRTPKILITSGKNYRNAHLFGDVTMFCFG